MAKTEINVVLYAVDLSELREWVGSGDEERFEDAWNVLQEDEDADWEPEELQVLERLLRRLIFEGKLYEGLDEAERYYLTQLLIDLFDEYVDQDPLTDDMPLEQVQEAVNSLPAGSPGARLARFLVRGRELDGDGELWTQGPAEDVLSFFGYVTRDEVAQLADALGEVVQKQGRRANPVLKQLVGAAEECGRAELDLLSFVG